VGLRRHPPARSDFGRVYLRSLRLRGFKSFPDAVEVRLEPGVAIVVGPNGSGKSNIADAIVWAAGSQSPTELRTEKPDDVLYAGSGECKAADFCEVELVFDNSDGFGPLDFSELSVTRRLQRGGEGQYLVNRAPVRRLDVVELLADLGLAGEMHSVIGQGRVEQILASRPADRRALVEEAAGLGKFKRRRHRAELKLARVEIQVERARDVEEEVRRRLRPLAQQATAAERAEKLAGQITALQVRIAQLDLAALDERLADGRARRAALELTRRSSTERLEAVLLERNETEEELADAAGKREEATAALYRLRSSTERVGLRRETVQGLLAQLRTDLASAEEALAPPRPEVERLRLAAVAAGGAAREAVVAHELAMARLRPAAARRAELADERLATVLERQAGLERDLGGATREREAATSVYYRLEAAWERVAMRREAAVALATALEDDLAAARAAAAPSVPSPADLERAANEAAAAARAAALERDSVAERAGSARERLVALERSLREREGIPPAARALAEAGERLALSLLEVEPGAERAVSAALAWRAAAILAQDPPAALVLLERARSDGLGSLTVVVDSAFGVVPVAPVPGARALPELVLGAPEARRLLEGVWLVEPGEILEASEGVVVTREGHGYDAERGELWFAGETAEAVLLELESRRRSLAEAAHALERRAGEAAAEADRAAEHAAAAEAAYAEVAHLRSARVGDPALLAVLAPAARRLDEALAAAAEAAARLGELLRARAAAAAERSAAISEELEMLAAAEGEARRAAAEAVAGLASLDVERARLGVETADEPAAAGDFDALVAGAACAARALDEARERARLAEEAYAEAAPRRERIGDPVRLAALADAAERLDEVLGAAAQRLTRFEAPLEGRAGAGAVLTGELAAELRRLGTAEAELRRETTEAAERLSALDVELARIEAEAEEIGRRLEGATEASGGDDREELAARVDRLERRREELGQVNPLAREEYEQEKARLAELTEQRADLEASLAELEKLRAELTETVERRFSETYAAVERHFAEIATTLFPGGRGRLLLTAEEGEEEPGIEIELEPAGKRITRLSLLSGGEKALGAISFLFALFLAQPCPFYLLDEVEAALDDTNIGRFVDLLRRFADRAQFIVVTHQKRTMEAADILYGVTMGAGGISQVVSKRLAAEPAHALTA